MATVKARQRMVLHLFERMGEPIYIPKGENSVVYNIPKDTLPSYIRPFPDDLHRFWPTSTPEMVVSVTPMPMPDLKGVKVVPRGEIFNPFLDTHRRAARALINLFLAYADFQDFLSMAALCRDDVNEMLFAYSLAVAVLNRSDMRGAKLPPVWEIFPDKFVHGTYIKDAEKQMRYLPTSLQKTIEIPKDFTGTDRDEEHRVAYFREDIGVNSHHWHWHLVYPVDGPRKKGQRKGELFYYLHQQMLARYDIERQANGLLRVKRLSDFREPIKEAYFPKLTTYNSARIWASRPTGMKMKDIDRDFSGRRLQFDIDDMNRWKNRIFEAIHNGFVRDSNLKKIPLDEVRGIDILGDIVEASSLSPNYTLYGNLHNIGHMVLSFVHDPDGRHKENIGVIGDTTTAMRDPLFYRWHKFIDDIFQEHKLMLPPYEEKALTFPGVILDSVTLVTQGQVDNTLITGWQTRNLELSHGLDFGQDSPPVRVRISHLQHKQFSYKIQVNNRNVTSHQATVRIFMAPKYNDSGEIMTLNEQRLTMIEMDKFVVKLTSGLNEIDRSSADSSVTIPFERTFDELVREVEDADEEQQNYCGCGWPGHMLLPRGKRHGMEFQLFVMITDWQEDKVELKNTNALSCRNAASFCGLRDEPYPDRRAMGFPFDRPVDPDMVNALSDFLTPNMKILDICILFTDKEIKK